MNNTEKWNFAFTDKSLIKHTHPTPPERGREKSSISGVLSANDKRTKVYNKEISETSHFWQMNRMRIFNMMLFRVPP